MQLSCMIVNYVEMSLIDLTQICRIHVINLEIVMKYKTVCKNIVRQPPVATKKEPLQNDLPQTQPKKDNKEAKTWERKSYPRLSPAITIYKASTRISKGAITLILVLIIRSLSLPWPELFLAAILLTKRRTCGSSGFWSLSSISSRLSPLLPLAVSRFFTPSSLAADFFCLSVGCFFFESEFG
jgi:hypothetical protein